MACFMRQDIEQVESVGQGQRSVSSPGRLLHTVHVHRGVQNARARLGVCQEGQAGACCQAATALGALAAAACKSQEPGSEDSEQLG